MHPERDRMVGCLTFNHEVRNVKMRRDMYAGRLPCLVCVCVYLNRCAVVWSLYLKSQWQYITLRISLLYRRYQQLRTPKVCVKIFGCDVQLTLFADLRAVCSIARCYCCNGDTRHPSHCLSDTVRVITVSVECNFCYHHQMAGMLNQLLNHYCLHTHTLTLISTLHLTCRYDEI